MSADYLEIDGSMMEGGGQILRNSIALSGLMKKNIKLFNIRAGRNNPGLRPQHLAGLQLAKNICNGSLTGDEIGSTVITFRPNTISGGKFFAETGTAGSVMLIFQVAFPLLLFADKPSELTLKGGTNAEMAPQIDETLMVFKPIAEYFGATFSCNIVKRGYFPCGGGHVVIKIFPLSDALKPVKIVNHGELLNIKGRSFVAGKLPMKAAYSMAECSNRLLKKHFPNISVDIQTVVEPSHLAVGNGSGIILVAETNTGCLMGSGALGKRSVRDEDVANSAAKMLINVLEKKACVDNFTQDQLIIFMALAKGKSKIKISDLTLHTKTSIFVAEIFTNVKFLVPDSESGENIIECEGIGFQKC